MPKPSPTVLLGGTALASWGVWMGTVLLAAPEPWLNRVVFFSLLFVGLCSATALGAYEASFHLFPLKRDQGDLARALFQGGTLAVAGTLAVWLQSLGALTVTMGVLILMALGFLELLALPRGPSSPR